MGTALRRPRTAISKRLTPRRFIVLLLLAILAALAARAMAVEAELPAEANEEDESSPYRPGLVAHYAGSDGVEHVRLEDQIAFAWGERPPDRRLPAGSFRARFTGALQVRSSGVYRLRVFAAGAVRLALAGKVLVDAAPREPRWLNGEPIELPFGFHALELNYRRSDEPARLALFWEGPQFVLEPVATRWLFHPADQTPPTDFDAGARWVRALRCAACHELTGESPALPAPALNTLAGNVSRRWLVEQLSSRPAEKSRVGDPSPSTRRMPHFDFLPQEAEAVADYLLATSDPSGDRATAVKPAESPRKTPEIIGKKKPKSVEPPTPPPPPSAAAGATLFRSLGCLACHRVGNLGTDGLFGGGDLSRVAEKRPAGFFTRWLADPATINRDHRMPTFALDLFEAESLALYLQALGAEPHEPKAPASPTERSRKLVEQARCVQCHRLPKRAGIEPARSLTTIDPETLDRTRDHCLFEPDVARRRPGYRLDAAQRRAVAAFITGVAREPADGNVRSGSDLLAERNCLGCHARGRWPGLAAQVPAIGEAEPGLRDMLPALAPPALSGVGDKLRDEALVASITASQPPRQSWLRVRMPKFPFHPAEIDALSRHFIDTDRIPDLPRKPDAIGAPPADSTLEAAGARLVTADGFGCTSCHAIGKWQPQKVALDAQGADLSQIGSRVRRAWFERWVRNPARLVTQMEMPAVQQPVRGVLEGNLDRQLAAVWKVLDRRGFTPPSPAALRVVRRANLPSVVEPAVALTEVVEVGNRPFVKPLLIGLPNRHNVLVDLATNRLAAWWVGDTARQQTRGKSWYWEAGMPQLLAVDQRGASGLDADLLLARDGERIAPLADGDYLTEFDWFEHLPAGLEFGQRLHFPANAGGTTVAVTQRFSALPAGATGETGGFLRHLKMAGPPAGFAWELNVLSGDVALDAPASRATLDGSPARLHVTLRSGPSARLTKTSRGAALVLASAENRPLECELEYRAEVAVDQFLPTTPVDRSLTRADLKVTPGFDAVRLPVTDQCMPTGLAWRPDGTLVVSSLEGRVWLGRDTDGDGLEDRLTPFSDELAAPFGVAASDEAVDVINKWGLVRLFDRDGDGQADRTEVLVSGWGHTRDYHDWAVGLPRDAAGNYYVSLPCQQDDRSEAGARLRGSVIKLVPREPTAADPRRYALEPLCGGLRFPQGIALSPAGDLFVTDNQGNYTPFNELNEVVRGARYGFINRLESRRGLNPPFRSAAIEIPHPWTRSVNGICFLETPPAVRERLGHALFGPLAGQLVGCEYDTRRLVRMSLERVAGEFQGAVYPLSTEPAGDEETFEGPLVCQIAPNGDLYVGNIRDSGWGAGSNTGSLVRMRWRGDLPAGIAAVRAERDGFAIDFTAPVDRARAAQAANYSVASYRRVPTPDYGAPDQDRRVEKIAAVMVADDGLGARLRIEGLRAGFVYEFHVRDLAGAGHFFPAEAYYTLRHRLP